MVRIEIREIPGGTLNRMFNFMIYERVGDCKIKKLRKCCVKQEYSEINL